MSNRDYLNRRIVPAFVLMLLCFIGFAAAGVAATPSLPWLAFIPFVGFGACILYLHYGVRCPRCRRPIAMLTFLPHGGYFRLSNNLRFCPFCGLDLEAEHADG